MTVLFSTQDGTGPTGYHAPADYTAVINLLVTFSPGTVSQTVDVHLTDTNCTPNTYNFSANLSSPVNAVILDGHGDAVIPPASAC